MTEENEQQMEQLFHDHYEQMYRLAFVLLHDNDVAKDVVSDVFSRLWDKQLIPDQAYLMRSVKNACINIIAKKKRDERLKQLLPLSEEKLTEEEPYRLEEYKDTAEELGISISAVNKHIVKGLRTLREKLKGK